MLIELAVRDLGVIEDLRLILGPGLTAVTGETGAGKTLVVTAIELLLGGRAEPSLVRSGAAEAWVEGRFSIGEDEIVLARAIPPSGRSRAYVNGRMATAAALADAGGALIDLHGQHEHQGLLNGATQRRALDQFAGVDLGPLVDLQDRIRDVERELGAMGGDERARIREIELLRFQVNEIGQATLEDPDEDSRLDAEEDSLGRVVAHRQASAEVADLLTSDDGLADRLRIAQSTAAGHAPLKEIETRLRSVAEEVSEIGRVVRDLAESLEEDPARLEAIRVRRAMLHDLRRKYGDRLEEVIAYHAEASGRLAELESHEARAAELDDRRASLLAELRVAQARVAEMRRAAAPMMASAIEENLRVLAMPRARLNVTVGDQDPGDDVTVLLAANPGGPPLPLAKVASGGELARTMLAARLVLRSGAQTLVFDEVDAGIGGEAAIAVGRALSDLADQHQVLVVTHLPQVAAFADHQVRVSKSETARSTVATAEEIDGDERVIELSRMLSGQPESATARLHAEELLASTMVRRGR